ncbi:MAG: hypothetical protein AAB913_00455 [Patescibacteria group bacterium]
MEYKNENKICQNCKKDFTIEPEDFNFYEKIKVPPPTWCPECRLIRRLAYREDRPLYKDKCDKCKKDIISIFNPESPFIAYCNSCWHGDSWDGTDYGRDYDFSRPFFEQFYELQKVVPCQAVGSQNCTDCFYSNGNIRCKNCTLAFDGYESINCYNCQNPGFTRDSLDSDILINGDHCYETVNSNNIYNTKFAYFSSDCIDSSFLFNCIGCSSCFGCVNLRNQKYCIFNKKYKKEEYQKEIKRWDLGNYKIIQEAKEKFWQFYYKIPRRFALIVNSKNITGDDIKNTKNCQNCFSTIMGVENCKYIFLCGLLLKDSYDMTFGGGTSELYYENSGGMQSQRCFFGRAPYNSRDIEYSEKIYNCSDCFGCAKLEHKKYCILNKQFTKEEYEKLIPKIKKHMNNMPYIDKKGRVYKYGEYFPSEFSLWAYNETWAQKYFPLTKKEALEKGFKWYDEETRDYKVTIKAQNLPDSIDNVTDSILDEVIECEHQGICNEQCTTAFRILPNELQFYRQMNLALPHLCPSCRYGQRIKIKNPPKLWHRKCMCNGVESENKEYKNTIEHFHGKNHCQNEFETAISDERKEAVYCEKCYQAEFV